MKIIHEAIRFPVTTAVGVILLVMFGFIGLFRLPVQLTPTVEEPEISVSTRWPGASPQEVEREIIEEQEEQLKTVEGLTQMESSSSDSRGRITLTFQVGTDIDSALLKVSNRLEQVPSYPEDADKPVIRSVDAEADAIAWFILQPTEENGYEGDLSLLFDFVDDNLKPAFERVPGVAASNIFGGREREMHVIVDPEKLAARRVTLGEVRAAIARENKDYSGGDFDEGKRRYVVRTIGEYQSPEDIENIVVAYRNGVPVYLRDLGHAELSFRKVTTRVFQKGKPVMGLNAVKEAGSNILAVMTELKEAVRNLNENLLGPRGLKLVQVYDETTYIRSAIDLVQQALIVGGILAIIILLLYLRSGTSTLVIAVAIPISIIGAFLMMYLFDRTLNVISLAGMAFAVGMVVDNSIVVLENIYRHRQMGKPRFTAAYDGAREVWGAVLASTLTTIAVFIPVVFIEQEAGQLFGDIALAISCAVGLSLLISITVIPTMSSKILRAAERDDKRRGYHNLWGGVHVARRFTRLVTDTVHWITLSTARRLAVVVVLTTAALGLSWLLMPKTEYLPTGNNNFIFGLLLPSPGLNVEEMASYQEVFEEKLGPLWAAEPGTPEAKKRAGGGITHFFFVARAGMSFMGARANEPLRARELIPHFQAAGREIPGAILVVNQRSLFQRGRGEGRNIDIDITGPDLDRLIALGQQVFGRVSEVLPNAQARPIPSLDLDNPELHVVTDRRRASEVGLSNQELGFAVNALVDGAKAADYLHEGREIDLKVMAPEGSRHRTHLLEQLPVATPDGHIVTLGSVAQVEVANGPQSIRHRERQRAITIQVTPDEQTPMELAMEKVEAEILDPMREQGALGGSYAVHLSGSADKLAETAKALRFNLFLALAITYLLMAALFESFLYPLVIMFSVPLAALGGFLGLGAMNLFRYQALDVLTMLGFVILIGTVVNNAILIVHQSLNHMREEDMDSREAIREAVSNRIRPIFMSVSTSVMGMMPLILFPGAGSELYRGLGSVVVGGLVVSTVFTLFLVPALFSLVLDLRAGLAARVHGWLHPAERPAGDDD